jgi:hypothetical protein
MAMSQPQVISAADTFFAKVVVSAFFLLGMALLVIHIARQLGHSDLHGPSIPQIGVDLVCIVFAARVVLRLSPLKRVALSDTTLHLSNFLREIVVPLRDVESVDQREGTETFVVIRFAHNTPFGRRIAFSGIGLFPPQPHPIVAELRAAVAAAKAR